MAISKHDAINMVKNLEVVKAWTEGKKIQYRTTNGNWVNLADAIDFSQSPARYRIRAEHIFKRYVLTWTDIKGETKERIFKGNKIFADRQLDQLLHFKGFRDAKLHTVQQKLEI
jgi:hypothetical protein